MMLFDHHGRRESPAAGSQSPPRWSRRLRFGQWLVTRKVSADWVVLDTEGPLDLFRPGDVLPWEETVCGYMCSGLAPWYVPDCCRVLELCATRMVRRFGVRAYAGARLVQGEAELFGTLCGISTEPQSIAGVPEIVTMLGRVLSRMIGEQPQVGVEEGTPGGPGLWKGGTGPPANGVRECMTTPRFVPISPFEQRHDRR